MDEKNQVCPPFDPESELVKTILGLGFTEKQIAQAQRLLWENVGTGEGGCNDVNAVANIMLSRQGEQGVGADDWAEDEVADEDDDESYEVDSEYTEEDDTVDEGPNDNEEEDDNESVEEVEGSTLYDGDAATHDVDRKCNPTHSSEQSIQPQSKSPKSLTLPLKLQHVAQDVSHLSDAIFALTEWATKAASREELELYFLELDRGNKVDDKNREVTPLRTILHRVLLFQPQQKSPQQDPSLVVAACANLLTCVLLSSACSINVRNPSPSLKNASSTAASSATISNANSNGAAHSSTIRKSLGELLRRIRTLISQIGSISGTELHSAGAPTPSEIAGATSNAIMELLQRASEEKALHEKRSKTRNDSDASVKWTKNGGVSCKSTLSVADQDQKQAVMQMLERDIEKVATDLSRRQPLHVSSNLAMQQLARVGSNLGTKPSRIAGLSSNVVLDIMTKRDRTKQVAEKSGMVLEISFSCRNQPEGGHIAKEEEEKLSTYSPVLLYQSTEGKDTLAQKILGTVLHTVLTSSVNEVESFNKEVEHILSDMSTKQINLSSRQTDLFSKRQKLTRRIDELRQELEELQQQEEQLVSEENEILSELEQLELSSDEQMADLKSKIEARSGHMAIDKEMRRAAEKMGELETAWVRSSTVAATSVAPSSVVINGPKSTTLTGENATPLINSLLPNKLDQYLHRALVYFQSEAQCVEFLRDRVSRTEMKVLDIEREINERSLLGIAANAETMMLTRRALKSNIDDDKLVIEALRNDAKKMRSDLLFRVENYLEMTEDAGAQEGKNGVGNTKNFKQNQLMSLERISKELTSIGCYDDEDEGLGKIFAKIPLRVSDKTNHNAQAQETDSLPEDIDVSSSHPEPPIAVSSTGNFSRTDDNMNVYDPSSLNGCSNLKTTSPFDPLPAVKSVKPKFSWASMASNTPKKEARSLLDIQKEEMSAKQTGDMPHLH